MDTAMAACDLCDYDMTGVSPPMVDPEPPTTMPTGPGGEIETTDCEPAWDEGQNFFGINRAYYEGHATLFEVGREIIADGTSYFIDAMNLPGNCNSAVALVYVANAPSCADGTPWVQTDECGFGGSLTATLHAGMTWSLPPVPIVLDGTRPVPTEAPLNCRLPEPAAGGTDCWEVTPWLEANGLPASDCSKYYDTYGGGRGCRIEDGRCDGFSDEEYIACPELVTDEPLILDGSRLAPEPVIELAQ